MLLAFAKNWFLANFTGDGGRSLQRVFTEIAILMNYAGFTKKFFEIVIVTLHPFGCCSTIKTYASRHFWRLPLCCLTSLSSHCSVFKVQFFQPLLKPDLKIQIPLGFEIQQQTAVFFLVGLSGLEPPTLRLSVVRSSQLSYRPILLVEIVGIEPATSCLQGRRSPS